MSIKTFNVGSEDNIEEIDMSYLGIKAYEIIDCDISPKLCTIYLYYKLKYQTQRVISWITTLENGKKVELLYSRGSHKESASFRNKHGINKFVYSKSNIVLWDSSRNKAITKFEKLDTNWKKRLKLLEKAYNICFPDEICGDDIDLGKLEYEHIQLQVTENVKIGQFNTNIMREYKEAEKEKLSGISHTYYLGKYIKKIKLNSQYYCDDNRFIEMMDKPTIDRKCYKLESLFKDQLEKIVGGHISFNICSIYKLKGTEQIVSLIVLGHSNEFNRNIGSSSPDAIRIAHRDLDSGIEFIGSTYKDSKPLDIKVVIVKHRESDISIIPEKLVNSGLELGRYELREYINSIYKVNEITYKLANILHIKTYERGLTKEDYEIYNLEDTPIEFRDQVTSILSQSVYKLSPKYSNLFGFKHADKFINRVFSPICNSQFKSLYNEPCLLRCNYEDGEMNQRKIVDTFGYGSSEH